MSESPYRPEFVDALKLLAQAFDDVVNAKCGRPVLVGGAAVEFHTGGALVSGDFDVVTVAQEKLEEALLCRGFERPSGPGVLLRGLRHPTATSGLGGGLDSDYLNSRILQETLGAHGLQFLIEQVNGGDHS
jgi:hypothetical protein